MAYEVKDMTGSLFANEKKAKDTHPDRTGTAVIDGTEYYISGWLKTKKDGKPWLSLAFKRKDAETKPLGGGLSGKSSPVDDSDVPF